MVMFSHKGEAVLVSHKKPALLLHGNVQSQRGSSSCFSALLLMVMFSHKGEAVLVSHKTPALLLMVMFSHKGEAVLVSHKTPALLLMVISVTKGKQFLFLIRHLFVTHGNVQSQRERFLFLISICFMVMFSVSHKTPALLLMVMFSHKG